MLLDNDTILAATKLTDQQIQMALARSGYTDKMHIESVEYRGMTCLGVFAYQILYRDPLINEYIDCRVYVTYKPDAVTEYITLFAEF